MCKIVLFIEIIVFYEMIVGNVSFLVFINIGYIYRSKKI